MRMSCTSSCSADVRLCVFPKATAGSLCLAAAIALASADAEPRERTAAIDDPCDAILAHARSATSLAALGQRSDQRSLDPGALETCRARLEREPAILRLAAEAEREIDRQRETARQQARTRGQKPVETHAANRTVMQAREEGLRAATQLTRSITVSAGAVDPQALEDPTAGEDWPEPPPGALPQIAGVTPAPIVPGGHVVITGSQFGHQPGSVRISLQGQTFTATVQDWSDTGINAYLDESVTGVGPTDAAVVRVRRHQGPEATRNVGFQPVMAVDLLSSERTVTGSDNGATTPVHSIISGLLSAAHDAASAALPTVSTRTVFSGRSLANHWAVSEYWIATQQAGLHGGGGCESAGPPTATPGGHQLATAVRISSPVGVSVTCTVFVEIVGPQGVDHGVGDLRSGQ